MKRIQQRITSRIRRKKGLRAGVLGSPARPRLTVFRSANHIYAQVIDDLSGKTLASASSIEKAASGGYGGNVSAATEVGKRLAERAVAVGIGPIVFDRNGFKYHGRVKGLADGAREGGLKF